MKNALNAVKMTRPNNNAFDLTHELKMSCNMGELVPISAMKTVPGDRFRLSCESIVRFAPLVAPVFHRFNVSMHYFFVPNRLVWDGWEDYITYGGETTGGTIPARPTVTLNTINETRLTDWFGIPPKVTAGDDGDEIVSAIPFAAYNLIFNEYYRDENLVNPLVTALINGDNTANLGALLPRNRAWEADYFTKALPFAQKGSVVDIPLGDVSLKPAWAGEGTPLWRETTGAAAGPNAQVSIQAAPPLINSTGDAGAIAYDPDGTLTVNATTINDLRLAIRLQEFLEKNARGGTRYTENILAHFGVRSSDQRMQRPEYITGTHTPVQISEVLNTTGTTELPQGNMAGHGVSVTSGKYGKYFCEEHGYIIGIMSIMPKTAYMQGIPKHFTEIGGPTEAEFWPTFAHLGEQPIFDNEIYAYNNGANVSVFGYTPRYMQYKQIPSLVTGQFRTTLNYWHAAREFSTIPGLNSAFVTSDPTHRIFAVTDPEEDKMFVQVLNKVMAVRPMPVFGTPTF